MYSILHTSTIGFPRNEGGAFAVCGFILDSAGLAVRAQSPCFAFESWL